MKKTLLTMTALSALVLISPALQDTAAANKPMIRIAKPHIKVKIDTKRLTNKATTRKTGKGIVKAGPQPEPPTRPGFNSAPTTMIAPPLPRPRPVMANADPDNNAFDQIVETLQSIEPPTEGAPEAYNEFEEDEDGMIGDIDAPATPELVLSNGFEDVFLIFGGVTPDFEFPDDAIQELPGAGSGGNPFEDPSSRLRRPRFGAGMEGPPVAGGGAPGNGGKDSDGWTYQGSVYGGRLRGERVTSTYTSQGPYGTATYTVDRYGDGSNRVTITATGPSGPITVTTKTSSPDDNNQRSYSTTVEDKEGNVIATASGTTDTEGVPNAADEDGDLNVDELETASAEGGDEVQPESTGHEEGGQGAPSDNDTGRGTGGCGMWTPFGGCTGTGPKVWDTTGQPNPVDDGSATIRSAGASIGPEAVTNGGDGSFGAEGNSGRGGGFGIDPCATVAGCGDGSGGPDNPVGSVDAAHAADR